MMKMLIATTIVFGGFALSAAGTASAATAYQCEAQAQQYAEAQYPTGGGAVGGGIAGGIIGGIVAGATGKNVGNGVAVGAGAGLVVGSLSWQNAKRDAHDLAYSQCMGGAQQVYAPAPPAYAPQAYSTLQYCAAEGQFCSFSGTARVVYGVGRQLTSGYFTNGVACSNDVFGDPAPHANKQCQVEIVAAAPSRNAASLQYCATEGGYCAFSGTAHVAYGAGANLTAGYFTNGAPCNNNVFGDPAPGASKACYILP